jgi:hypothetical protein
MRKLLVLLIALGLATPAYAQSPGVNSNFNPVWSIPIDSIKRSYSASVVGLVAAAAATDIFKICGSATTTVRVTQFLVSGRATANANADVAIIKRSTAGSGGTATTPTVIPLDTGFSAGTAVVSAYTANPTVGTAVGTISAAQLPIGNLTTATSATLALTYGNRPSSAVVLRGVAQCLAVNLSAGTFAGNLWNVSVEWTEE